jgi:predicted histone-like DNA-binding protein
MAFYVKQKAKVNNKWYPRSITVGKPVSTDNVADKLAELSTVTRGDAYAIMKNLGSVMASYMAAGRTVKLEGVGTFYYTAKANKQGVDTADEVSADQIKAVRVRFIPEVARNTSSQVTTRSLINNELFWMEWAKPSKKTGNKEDEGEVDNGGNGNEGGDGDDELDPLG